MGGDGGIDEEMVGNVDDVEIELDGWMWKECRYICVDLNVDVHTDVDVDTNRYTCN